MPYLLLITTKLAGRPAGIAPLLSIPSSPYRPRPARSPSVFSIRLLFMASVRPTVRPAVPARRKYRPKKLRRDGPARSLARSLAHSFPSKDI